MARRMPVARCPRSACAALAVLGAFLPALPAPAAPEHPEVRIEMLATTAMSGTAGTSGTTSGTTSGASGEGSGGPSVGATGRLVGLDEDAVRVERDGAVSSYELDRLLSMRFARPRAASLGRRAHLQVELLGGERILGTGGDPLEGHLVLRTPEAGPLRLPFEAILTITSVPPDAGPCFEPPALAASDADGDLVLGASGDVYVGVVVAAQASGLVLQDPRGQRRTVSWHDLVTARLQNPPAEAAPGRVIEVETAEGSRLLTERPLRLVEGRLVLTLRSLPDEAVELPLDAVRVVRARGGAFVYASDLPFEGETGTWYGDGGSLVAEWFAVRADRRRMSGCPLRLGGVERRHGFAMIAPARARIRLGRAHARFGALFGIDDEAVEIAARTGLAGAGDVDARVLGDGKLLWEAKGVRGGDAPIVVGPLDVSQVEVLELVVDPGKEIWLRRATWADPVLERR